MRTESVTQPNLRASARYYADRLRLVLAHMPQGSKAPTHRGWNTVAVLDTPEKAEQHWIQNPHDNMGVCHNLSHTIGFDVDAYLYARDLLARFGIDIDDWLNAGCRVSSGSPDRARTLFRLPPRVVGQRVSLMWPHPEQPGKEITIFEIRGGATQDVLPPSLHTSGRLYQWEHGLSPQDWGDDIPEAPEGLVQLLLNWKEALPMLKSACPWAGGEVPMQLPPPSLHEKRGADKLIDLFNDLHSLEDLLQQAGYIKKGRRRYLAPSSSTGLAGVIIFDDDRHFFSHHGSCPFGDGHRHDAFDVWAHIHHGGSLSAALKVWRMMNQPIEPPQAKSKTQFAPPPAPDGLMDPPGIVGDIARDIIDHAIHPQPALAVMAALHLVGAVTSRRVQSNYGHRTNLMSFCLAPTGAGKDAPRKYMKMALHAFGREVQIGGEDMASASGLINRLYDTPDVVFLVDEAGDFLRSITARNAPAHKQQIMSALMRAHTSADSVMVGAEYADSKQRKVIEYPSMQFMGSSTPEVFWDGATTEMIYSGALNRCIVVESNEPRRETWGRRIKSAGQPAHSIMQWHEHITDWFKRNTAPGALQIDPANPPVVPFSTAADELFKAYEIEVNERVNHGDEGASMAVRVVETAAKVALIVGCGKRVPSIEVEDAAWAIKWVKHWHALIERAAARDVGATEREKCMSLVLSRIAEAGAEGVSHRTLFAHSRILRRLEIPKRDELIAALHQQGELCVVQRGRVIYYVSPCCLDEAL